MHSLWPQYTTVFPGVDSLDCGPEFDNGYTDCDSCQRVSNKIRPTVVGNDCVETLNSVSLPPNQWAEITIATMLATGTQGPQLQLRSGAPPGGGSYAFLALRNVVTVNGSVIISNPAGTFLASESTTVWGAGDKIMGQAIGATLTMWRQASGSSIWTKVLTVTDSTYTTGRAGWRLFSGTAVGDVEISSFRCGSFIFPPNPQIRQAVKRASFF